MFLRKGLPRTERFIKVKPRNSNRVKITRPIKGRRTESGGFFC